MQTADFTFGSVCSGIEAASVAFGPLGWKPLWFSEIEPFPCSVLTHHYPDVPNLGDMTQLESHEYVRSHNPSALVGGTPCQGFSVAGLRKGLGDDRSNLALAFVRLALQLRSRGTRWLLWENVPGVFSTNGGQDFCDFLSGLAGVELSIPPKGWRNSGLLVGADGHFSLAWRVLDAQYFGVPQRRRRVFVVGHSGDWRRAAAVLFERHSLSGDTPPRREKGQSAPTIPSRSSAGGGLGTDFDCDGGLIASTGDISHCLNAGGMGRQDYETETLLTVGGFPDKSVGVTIHGTDKTVRVASFTDTAGALTARAPGGVENSSTTAVMAVRTAQTSANGHGVAEDVAHTLDQANGQAVMTLAIRGRGGESNLEVREDGTANAILTPNGGRAGIGVGAVAFTAEYYSHDYCHDRVYSAVGISPALNTAQQHKFRTEMAVRRLMPVECNRLQGFPDDYLDVLHRGKPAADGPKYKALGNSWAVPCVRWIGERIQKVDSMEFGD